MECIGLKENVTRRAAGATAGMIIGLIAAIALNQATGYDITVLTVVIGGPLAALLARAYGGPISEAMGSEERGLTRNVKLALMAIGVLAAGAFGVLTGNLVNGVGLAFMLVTVSGPRLGVIFDERMGRIYGRSATVALGVFSLCAAYVGFYQRALHPELVTVDSFMMVIWITWASLVLSLAYYYFLGGE